MSPIGKLIGTLVGILGVAIFAVPAGLIGSGLTDAMDEEKREDELNGFRRRMQKAFRRSFNKGLREYLNALPDGGGEAMKALNIVPQRVKVAKMQTRQGMDMNDIIDTCNKFPEFRLKNLADAYSDEDDAGDRFVIEHFPLNRSYGCFVNRGSKVTIVSTGSFDEVGMGWFTYYLAKMGGFNYLSKELEVDTDELDSFYNLSEKPLYDKKPLSAYDEKKDKEAVEILKEKQARRDDFFADLRSAISSPSGGGQEKASWVIIITEHLKTKENQTDFHFAYSQKGGADATINDMEAYQHLFEQFDAAMKADFGLDSVIASLRYPLLKKNLGYTIRKDIAEVNVFVLRPSSELVNFNDRKLAIAYRMASVISQQLDGGRGIQPDDIKDFKETGFGYAQD
jgi:voltage-gated potassium channel